MINSIEPIKPEQETKETTVKFRAIRETTRIKRDYDPTKIFIEKAGQKINLYDFVQESSKDLEIYEVLEKYGPKVGQQMLNSNKSAVTGDLTGAPKDLRELHDMKQKADEAKEKISKILTKAKKEEIKTPEKKTETPETTKLEEKTETKTEVKEK